MCKEIVNTLKENNQDFEWYPTTDEIIDLVSKDCEKSKISTILDIGAGNGKVLNKFPKLIKYAIEKSQILIDQMPDNIFILGTDFYHNTLIDKKVDVIFCNPPYSDYVTWVEKIIKEANAKYIYFVIPERWQDNEKIKKALELRTSSIEGFKTEVLGSFDFLNAERQARAKVEVVKITYAEVNYYDKDISSDPFQVWFEETFKFQADKKKESDYELENKKKEELKSLIKNKNVIEKLEEFYNADMQKLLNNYKAVEKLDSDILKELNVNILGLMEGLKLKIINLKSLYWKELFDNFNKITDRLTSKSRKKLLDKLQYHTNIDFTASNAYAVVIWAIKNANKYFDEQLKDIYLNLSDRDNVRLYKSNNRIIEDGWRYNKSEMSKYSLDYRIIHNGYHTFSSSSYMRYDFPNGLYKDCNIFINDICTIAKNLGFNVITNSFNLDWVAGKTNVFYLSNRTEEVFAEVKAFKNGNMHFKFNQKFMKKFNIEAARINGWVKSPKEAGEEMDISKEEVKEYYNNNFQLCKKDILLLESSSNI